MHSSKMPAKLSSQCTPDEMGGRAASSHQITATQIRDVNPGDVKHRRLAQERHQNCGENLIPAQFLRLAC
jgi:hypothetical protein